MAANSVSLLFAAALAFGSVPGAGAASTAAPAAHVIQQSPYDTRAELQETARQLEGRLETMGADSEDARRIRQRLQRVHERLDEGDFSAGDMVAVRVQGADQLSGTFRVDEGRSLRIPTLGTVDLSGVLYAEADSVVRTFLSEYVKTDRIQVRPLMRVAVLGAVSSPGFYDLSPSATLSDALMEAGGPTSGSNLEEMRLRRDGRTVLRASEGGLPESASLAELAIERGDQLYVPERGGSALSTVLSVVGAIGSMGFLITQIF